MLEADYKGKITRRFCWRKLKFKFGRMCHQTDCSGRTLRKWWEWEK